MSLRLHQNPPFRVEHIGSLIRPAALVAKRVEFLQGKCSAEELKAAEDVAIPAVVRLQQEAGIKSITDGEMRRTAFYEGMFEKLDGMTIIPNCSLSTFKQWLSYVAIFKGMGMTEYPSIYCSGKIKRSKGIHTDDFKFLKSCVAPGAVKNLKLTICGPTWMHMRHGSEHTYDKSVYKTDAEYFADLAQAYREEIQELYSLGCRNIQFDDPTWCGFCADSMILDMEKAGVDYRDLLSTYVDLYNDCIRDRPADLTIGVHMCRGNFKGMHFIEGGYERIAEKLFRDLNVDCYYMEYDDERSGDMAPLQYLPLGKAVVLGLVTTKRGDLETVADIRARVEHAADIISQGTPKRSKAYALDQICISPQCGFASVFEGNPLSEEDERRKLGLVVEAAQQIWPDA
ncbi:UROD/MetE-like protein [Obba rivulosa]|uniref:UROD/MetE-like protein n=1 Tax=Obba rivulosa TaxID=1052685 RepID=A0A8E2DUW2_9APHY|nr:UROD/MetE-like protein [Obba rivulosa]